ncbi:uncharacterized protein BO72DRAFT_458820 [Aspergillus fijiensis CBS 313.89]|uniref:Uncharacterized protein n=1 Tax=Aspergillus fijiensis CBS 313.89 TaxID=1448319 RepID=A0A8G1VZE8_9EURO|nr:uncharacterized protein BO72DRAFT_458820 [Aspergillus fijiensis CBS 313.89]RAK77251.1 hypothetical protein BO72DRAFT_458820 [Aspergillus fijiensis CBS 313.89]
MKRFKSENLFWSSADVCDVTPAHLRAKEVPAAGIQCFFICTDYFTSQQFVDALRAGFREFATACPSRPGIGDVPADVSTVDTSKSRKVLEVAVSLAGGAIVDDAGRTLLRLEKAEGA